MEELFVQDPSVATGKVKREDVNEMQNTTEKKESGKKTIYSHEEAVDASISYFKGDELAARVWANKYALKDSFGNLFEKTPDDMHRRLAREIHRIERKYKNPIPEELIYSVLKDFKYAINAVVLIIVVVAVCRFVYKYRKAKTQKLNGRAAAFDRTPL